ncbi:hypothetical protein [Dactylosporangium sp. CS-033363]|uniref:hypothetical protein n=1 Tax=Dactylosporangium sp. CS-033363 TaxID=3239935 RepID=UPI003D8D9892
MTDHWSRLEEQTRRQNEQHRKDQADYIRRFGGGAKVPKTPKQYPGLNDPPPGKAKFAAYAIAFVFLLLLLVTICGATVYVFFNRMPHP